ncbi:DUF4296 domain-containing protein [Flavobacterium microcysteis]|uniref:DUF4296 domain-containing protein n=1 Tax=Flavobacterium microcysteis TaxID=2596891 RepID=A0A501Q7M9_9FLAO|nr:DUF4296 domain-containing protein [Flavobacterium microcysteis]TPD68408.1 DUF4296 domain-containing protein [Flavobacterium microcysteis]
MKKYFLLLVLLSMASCQQKAIEEPANLIPRDKMKQIIYDLSLLQGIKGVSPAALDSNGINPATYVYKKYKIDSLQFAKSDQYYAVENIKEYAKMYEDISKLVGEEKMRIDSQLSKEADTTKTIERSNMVKANKDSAKQ